MLGPTHHGSVKPSYFYDPNGHRVELATDIGTDEQYAELKRVAPIMLEEWSKTKTAPRHADWLHEIARISDTYERRAVRSRFMGRPSIYLRVNKEARGDAIQITRDVYERLEVRDAVAYFRVIAQPADDLAFERIVNTPKRGLGNKAVQTIQRAARSNGVNLVEGARIVVQTKLLGGKGLKELTVLVEALDRWHGQVVSESDTHVELAEMILDESGYTGMWQNDKTPEAPGRLENLKELVKALEAFDSLQGFLEHVALIMDHAQDDAGEKVSIMTLHAAKGLEFPMVFLPGWEDGLFPSQRSMDESGQKGLEEERRLAYVGITRARQHAYISFVANRQIYGRWQSVLPSRFVDELPHDHVEAISETGFSGMPGGESGFSGSVEDLGERSNYKSPGWQRLKENAGRFDTRPPRDNTTLSATSGGPATFKVGTRIFHDKFGYGRVAHTEGNKLTVDFEKSGRKKVIATFVQPV